MTSWSKRVLEVEKERDAALSEVDDLRAVVNAQAFALAEFRDLVPVGSLPPESVERIARALAHIPEEGN